MALQAVICATGVLLAAPAMSMADSARFNIPAQPLATALRAFAEQSHMQLLYQYKTVNHASAASVSGDLDKHTALDMLLKGTGLEAVYSSDNAATIRAIRPATANSTSTAAEEGKKSSSGGFRMAQVDQGAAQSAKTVGTADSQGTPSLEEIVVTAQKREERLLDVPMSLTALGGDELERSQSFRLEDYAGKVPGLTLIENGALGSQLVIRGITSGVSSVNSLVATYVDETPYTTEGPYAASFISTPNIDTFDMARIEVLRGPQGTLYGANALGGILKYVTNAPDPSGFAAKVEASANTVDHGGNGFDVHGMVNAPIAEDLAVRAVMYEDYYPGFIDDPSGGLQDVNGARTSGGRVSLQYRPSSDLTVRLNAMYQERRWNDWGTEDVAPVTLAPLYGNWIHENLEGQPGHATTQLYNATVNWNTGIGNIVSTTSYYDEKIPYSYDYSKLLGGFVSQLLGAPYGLDLELQYHIRAFTQEVRVSSAEQDALHWLAGAYFTEEHAQQYEYLYPIDPTTRTLVYNLANLGAFDIPTSYREYAAFLNLDHHFTGSFDIGVGGRYSENRQKFHETGSGTFGGGLNFGNPASQGVFTYSVDASWHFMAKHMLYGRIASGYAPGGPNNALTTAIVPSSYEASTSVNYELGLKSSLLDDRLTAEVSAFLVNWRKIQLNTFLDNQSFTTNAGGARSEGVEWSFSYMPLRGLTLNLNGAYTDAYLTEATPADVNGHAGDRLPAVPMWQSSAGAEYRRPLFDVVSGVAGIDWRFSGNRYADFEQTGPRQQLPSFSLVDIHLGLQTPRWQVSFFVKNTLNKIAINYVQSEAGGGFGNQAATVYAPRTYGVTVAATL